MSASDVAVPTSPRLRFLAWAILAAGGACVVAGSALARGIYPPLMADRGLPAALEAQAHRAPVSTTVHGDGLGRFGQDVEAAIYFSCLEALQNVAKYARASAVGVRLADGDGRLTSGAGTTVAGMLPVTDRQGAHAGVAS